MDLENLEVKINKPYPELTNVQEDMQTVGILKNLANGRVGEMNGVLQYIYQSVIADKTKQDIAEIFEEIGVVEMIHLDMLMYAIREFGGVPKFEDSQGNSYSANSLNYTMKLNDMLNNNIKAETMAIDNYKTAIQRVKNQSLKDLFERIIEDEQRHIEIFKYMRDTVEFMSI